MPFFEIPNQRRKLGFASRLDVFLDFVFARKIVGFPLFLPKSFCERVRFAVRSNVFFDAFPKFMHSESMKYVGWEMVA